VEDEPILQGLLWRIRIKLINNTVGVSLDPLCGLRLKALEVFACPVELY
jgi:hypothetical protein